jgi:hypothetical protein
MIAVTILAMVAVVLGTLSNGVQRSYEYTDGFGMATQHGRVVCDRIIRTLQESYANEKFPGFIVVPEQQGTWRFPENLAVWHPAGTPAAPADLPRFNEVIVYCTASNSPNNLIELTVPTDTRTVPSPNATEQWLNEIRTMKVSANSKIVTLTTLLRACAVPAQANSVRGAVRFETRLRPDDTQWQAYKSSPQTWAHCTSLPWVQGLYGTQGGLRQSWVRFELQIMPGLTWTANDPRAQRAVPFFGSAAVYFQLKKPNP